MIILYNFRFPSCDLLSAFGVLSMRPIAFLNAEDLDEYGTEQIQTLINHYGTEKVHRWDKAKKQKNKAQEYLRSETSPPLIDGEATLIEWKDVKDVVLAEMLPKDSTQHLWHLIVSHHEKRFPNLVKLAHLGLTCPIHTAGCERGFSAQNLILTPLRNRLTPKHQDMLMRVKLGGKVASEFDFNKALEFWANKCKRKLLTQKKA